MSQSAEQMAATKPKHLVQSIHTAPEMLGRREFFTYRDIGLKEATGGAISAKTMRIKKELKEPTGWHYHTCQSQIAYILNGWVDIAFEDGTERRVEAGDVLMIPGHYLHNELATSDDIESLEFTIPGEMGTFAADPPEWWVERERQKALATAD